jgi:hypothetical protein
MFRCVQLRRVWVVSASDRGGAREVSVDVGRSEAREVGRTVRSAPEHDAHHCRTRARFEKRSLIRPVVESCSQLAVVSLPSELWRQG